ncbi:hypothetical protein CBS63078_6143 [Aspergillus niger]|nr:hypothetical protein CBS115989_7692 [Aspergillus niger]KAI2838982.1 hypothetical protein CBS11232_9501 [Aspergillus niger]KAI2868718.1 hypothetical protein CBS115988_10520 [Aspergillus niger]KAI2871946.1 hypothetical protein CBS11852_10904 [Aspergillus niger]KAI2885057.1 hypothetical protein CBS13152_7570 [Aspergillus niger]
MAADQNESSTVDAVTERPAPPYTIFDRSQKRLLAVLVSAAATFSTLASNIYFPAIPSISRSLNVSTELVNLSITSYLIFQGLAPSLWGPISDVKGRRIAYIVMIFGWTVQYSSHVHIAVPIISTFITGWTAVSNQSIVTTYLVDVFHDSSAAASASLNMARCCLAAAGSGFVMPMVNRVGCGVAFTWRYGGLWRSEMEKKWSR